MAFFPKKQQNCLFSNQVSEVFLAIFMGFLLIISKILNGSLCFAKELPQKVASSRRTNELENERVESGKKGVRVVKSASGDGM